MSYILDALRKSEQQRQRGGAPRLLAVQTMPEADARPVSLKYGLIAAALIGAGFAIGIVRPWQHAQPSSATDPFVAEPLNSKGPTLEAPASAFPSVMKSGREPSMRRPGENVKRNADPAVPVAKRQGSAEEKLAIHAQIAPPDRTAMVVAAPNKATVPTQEMSTNVNHTDVPSEQTVLTLTSLPLSIQREIPAMSIQGHAFSSVPKDRVVLINDRLVQEGEYAAPGLRLEHITPDGLVLSYKNYQFRQGL